jgi:hypothetical protein
MGLGRMRLAGLDFTAERAEQHVGALICAALRAWDPDAALLTAKVLAAGDEFWLLRSEIGDWV